MVDAAEPTSPRSRADWARAAEGIQLAGIAVFLLLNTTGYLPWSFWLDAIALWPLLIMSAGIRIAFERTRAPWLVLVGPVIILSGLAWLASGARPDLPSGPWEPEVASRPAGVERALLDARLVGARLHVATATDLPDGRLVDGRSMAVPDGTRLETDADGGVARVQLRAEKRHGVVFLPRAKERWDLRLPADLPIRVEVSGAGVVGEVDLTRGTVEGLRTKGAFIRVDVRLPAASRETPIKMEGAFNALALNVPEGTPVRVHGAGLPFNAVDRGVKGAPGRPGYEVTVDGIFSAVDVRSDPGISPEPPAAPTGPPPVEAPASAPAPHHPKPEAEPSPTGRVG